MSHVVYFLEGLVEGLSHGIFIALKELGLDAYDWHVQAAAVVTYFGAPFVLVFWLKYKFDKQKDE